MHITEVEDPTTVEYVPAAQAKQVAIPVFGLYVPATHAVHEPPFAPVDPALQVQLVEAELPAGELEFDGQTLHVEFVEAPTAVEYVPAEQSVHASGPVNTLYFPAAHAEQLVAPTAVEYVPASQFEQVAFPVNVLYFPATHAVHGPPSGPVHPKVQVQLLITVLPAGERVPVGQEAQLLPLPTAVDQ
jgi:hypothetical protein